MKKGLIVVLVLVLLLGCLGVSVAADTAETTVTVTIADAGKAVLVQKSVTVTDSDGDGALTINDALHAAHEAAYTGGSAAGYATAQTQYGLSMVKLWGNESGNFGYYLNHASAWSLVDAVKNGDRVYAYVYSDTAAFSDMYAYFDRDNIVVEVGEKVTLTLLGATFDAEWKPVVVPVAGATITVDGKETAFKTDDEGKVTLTLENGKHTVSATSNTQVLIPPFCVASATVAESKPEPKPEQIPATGEVVSLSALALLGAMVAMCVTRKSYAK